MNTYYFLLLLAAIGLPLSQLWHGTDIPEVKAVLPVAINDQPPAVDSNARTQILAHNLWDKQRGQIIERHPLGQAETTDTTAQTVRNWTLKAVKMPNIAVFKTDAGMKHYAPMQTLPTGEVLRKIFIDGITLEKNSTQYNVYLFGKKPKSHH